MNIALGAAGARWLSWAGPATATWAGPGPVAALPDQRPRVESQLRCQLQRLCSAPAAACPRWQVAGGNVARSSRVSCSDQCVQCVDLCTSVCSVRARARVRCVEAVVRSSDGDGEAKADMRGGEAGEKDSDSQGDRDRGTRRIYHIGVVRGAEREFRSKSTCSMQRRSPQSVVSRQAIVRRGGVNTFTFYFHLIF